ncbi:ATP-binding cassette domain-containing protein [Granulicella arctica]|uniref:Osmoprotectant transport system ATP-binding protein n=1 Tax=Granulicella arctica TaxID=940613 RepID=A0A7Y9PJE1_9BACT|nr:osmoprotectant transport system ATP-binding protein [Granulicella arctica]
MGGVEFAKVSYALPDGRFLLRDISLRLEEGTTTALLGRSGSGKTTLLRMVNGLVMPTAGEVLVAGKATGSSDMVELRRGIGYVIQETGLFPHMTVERNAGLALELAGQDRGAIVARVKDVLIGVGMDLAEFQGRYPWQLSGGQRQRVGLARALATDPAVLLMDEPFGALDPMTRAEMQTMVRQLFERVKKTVLLVTHDLDEALYLAQRVVFLAEGKVVADILAKDVLRSEDPQVKAYVQAVHRGVPV